MNDVETKIAELSKKIEKIKSIVIRNTLISTNVGSAEDFMQGRNHISTAHQNDAEA